MNSVPVGLTAGSFFGDCPEPAWFRDLFIRLEDLGFSDCAVADRPTHPLPMLDPLSLLAVGAATTHRIGLVGILVTPYRTTVPLARELSTLQYLSEGRLRIAPALGGDFIPEMRACGIQDRRELPHRLEEGLELMRRFWSGEEVTYEGEYHEAAGLRQLPFPPASVPVWLAHRARSEASLRRTANCADGWVASWVSPDRLRRARTRIAELAERAGRSPDAIETVSYLRVYLADTVRQGAEEMARLRTRFYGHPFEPELVEHLQVVGPPDECRRRIAEVVDAGAQRLLVHLECEPQQYEDQLNGLISEVLEQRDGRLVAPAAVTSPARHR